MKYLNILALLIINTIITNAQVNFVLNPSFEEIDSCLDINNRIYRAQNWDTLRNGGGGTPDLFNDCCTNISVCGVPTNWSGKGYQFPKSGKGYAGAIVTTSYTNGAQLREFIQGKMYTILLNGNNYCVKFYISLSNRSKYSSLSIGGYLDNGQLQSSYFTAPNPIITPQIQNNLSQLDDTLNWVAIEGSFTANGTEEYITIGNFFPDSLSGIQSFQPGGSFLFFEGSYYYIDDVSVIDISTPAFAGDDKTIMKGDSVYLGRPSEIGLDEACIWFLNGMPIDTVAGITVAPDSTTTYVLEQTICGNVQYDTVTVTIDTGTGLNHHEKAYKFEIYPNPNDGNMMLAYQLETNEKGKITVCDITGRQVISYNLANDQNNLSISQAVLENGVYFFSIMVDGNVVATKKVVIIK
jgi:hypothetical protein